jgi:hypothetical protein
MTEERSIERIIQQPSAPYRIIDRRAPGKLLGVAHDRLAACKTNGSKRGCRPARPEREPQWSEVLAVGRRSFVERVQEELGPRAWYRHVEGVGRGSVMG